MKGKRVDDFLVIGEALIDIVRAPGVPDVEHVGGSPANVALGLGRLGHPVGLATALGPDERGRRIGDYLRDSGVSIADGSYCLERTATALAVLDEHHAASYEFDIDWRFDPHAASGVADGPVAGDLAGTPAGKMAAGAFTHVHTGSIAAYLEPGGSAVADFATHLPDSVTLSFDPNIRPSLLDGPSLLDAGSGPHPAAGAHPTAGTHPTGWVRERTEQIVAVSHVVKASDEDLAYLYPEVPLEAVVQAWSQGRSPITGESLATPAGYPLVIATRGGDGAIAGLHGQTREFPAARVVVADTVGAGDSFMAGLLSGLADLGLLGADSPTGPDQVAPAISRALACAALTVQRAGADLPTRGDLPTT